MTKSFLYFYRLSFVVVLVVVLLLSISFGIFFTQHKRDRALDRLSIAPSLSLSRDFKISYFGDKHQKKIEILNYHFQKDSFIYKDMDEL